HVQSTVRIGKEVIDLVDCLVREEPDFPVQFESFECGTTKLCAQTALLLPRRDDEHRIQRVRRNDVEIGEPEQSGVDRRAIFDFVRSTDAELLLPDYVDILDVR